METMKAAVFYAPGDIRTEQIPYPKCNPEGAIVKIHACGVCNVMDIDAWIKWQRGGAGIGKVRGHEWSGEIVELGSRVKGFEVGDRIFQNPVFKPCYKCAYCMEGDYWRCVDWTKGLAQSAINGGFAEYVWIPFINHESAAKMPDSVSWIDLAMIEPLYLAVGLARKTKPGSTAVVLGLDLMGLGTIAKLKEQNGTKVIAVDVSPRRLSAAEELGADVVINSLETDVVKTVMQETKGHGADYVYVIDLKPLALMQAWQAVRRAGFVWLAGFYYSPFRIHPSIGKTENEMTSWIGPGTCYTDPSITWDPNLMHMQIAWGTMGERVPRWLEAAEMIKAGTMTAEKHITTVLPLEKTKEAFDLAATSHDEIKVVVQTD